mgnify:CR=1 FL=1
MTCTTARWPRGRLAAGCDADDATTPRPGREQALLILAFDEDDGAENNQLATVLYGPAIRPQHAVTTWSRSYDLLRTLEDSWSLTPLTANDGQRRR